MKIFKAEPVESRLNEPHWNTSTHKGWVIIRAIDEERAKHIASLEFRIATHHVPGDIIPGNPWREGLVNYTEITESEYSVEGEEGVLAKE